MIFAAVLGLVLALALAFFIATMPRAYLEEIVALAPGDRVAWEDAQLLLACATGIAGGIFIMAILYEMDRLRSEIFDFDDTGQHDADIAMAAAPVTADPPRPIFSVEEIGQPPADLPFQRIEADEEEPELDLGDWMILEDSEHQMPFTFAINAKAGSGVDEAVAGHAAQSEVEPVEDRPIEFAPGIGFQSIEGLLARYARNAPPAAARATRVTPSPTGAIQARVEELKRMASGGR